MSELSMALTKALNWRLCVACWFGLGSAFGWLALNCNWVNLNKCILKPPLPHLLKLQQLVEVS